MRRMLAILTIFLLYSCGGGGGSNNNNSTNTEIAVLNIFEHNGASLFPENCSYGLPADALKVKPYCVWEDSSSGRVEVTADPAISSVSTPGCISPGNYKVDIVLPLPSATSSCVVPPVSGSWVLRDAYYVAESTGGSKRLLPSPLSSGEVQLVLEPLSTIATSPYKWWFNSSSNLPVPSKLQERLNTVLAYAGISSYPSFSSTSDLLNFVVQVKTNLGLPADAVYEHIANVIMEKHLQSLGLSLGEYMAGVSDLFDRKPPSYKVWKALGISSLPSLTPLPDTCVHENGTTFSCLKFHEGKLAFVYDTSGSSPAYNMYALNSSTGRYEWLRSTYLNFAWEFEVPQLQPGESVSFYSSILCEASSVPFTIRCYAEVTTNYGNTYRVENDFVFDFAGYTW